jgi:hypothetical protein
VTEYGQPARRPHPGGHDAGRPAVPAPQQSPEGVATFTADGAVYVQRNDPDVAMLLGIGAYAPPVVG